MGRVEADQSLDILFVFLDIGLRLENSTVFQSQVVDQILALLELGYSVGLLVVSADEALFEGVVGARLRPAGAKIHLIPERGFGRNLVAMVGSLRRLRRTWQPRQAYVRGLWGSLVIALAGLGRRLPYVYDVRGDLDDEMVATGTPRFKRAIYRYLERTGIRRAKRVSAVTRALADFVAERDALSSVSVIPCCIDPVAMTAPADAAAAFRASLGIGADDILLVYAGGLSHYQQVPRMLDIWRGLRGEPGVRFLLLTNDDPQKLGAVVGDLGDFGSALLRLSLPRKYVPAALAAADIGFMLRDTRSLNRVASPVKFPEYLCAGLAIVASPGTGDASALLERFDVGVLVDPAETDRGIQLVRRLIADRRMKASGFRKAARSLVDEYYDWKAHSATFQYLYGAPSRASN